MNGWNDLKKDGPPKHPMAVLVRYGSRGLTGRAVFDIDRHWRDVCGVRLPAGYVKEWKPVERNYG